MHIFAFYLLDKRAIFRFLFLEIYLQRERRKKRNQIIIYAICGMKMNTENPNKIAFEITVPMKTNKKKKKQRISSDQRKKLK